MLRFQRRPRMVGPLARPVQPPSLFLELRGLGRGSVFFFLHFAFLFVCCAFPPKRKNSGEAFHTWLFSDPFLSEGHPTSYQPPFGGLGGGRHKSGNP